MGSTKRSEAERQDRLSAAIIESTAEALARIEDAADALYEIGKLDTEAVPQRVLHWSLVALRALAEARHSIELAVPDAE